MYDVRARNVRYRRMRRHRRADPLTFADVPLLYEAPEHVRAAMAVRRFVKRFLTEAVPMAGWSLGRARRHIPRSTAEPLTPDFHREATQGASRDDDNIITRPTLRDLGTVRVHNCAVAVVVAIERSLAHSSSSSSPSSSLSLSSSPSSSLSHRRRRRRRRRNSTVVASYGTSRRRRA